MNKKIVDTLTKVHEFIEANKNINYKIRLLEQEVPNIGELVENLTMPDIVGRSEQLKAKQEAYDKGYNDGAQAAANDILN